MTRLKRRSTLTLDAISETDVKNTFPRHNGKAQANGRVASPHRTSLDTVSGAEEQDATRTKFTPQTGTPQDKIATDLVPNHDDPVPEEYIPLDEFIRLDDGSRFHWVSEVEIPECHSQQSQHTFQKHVKLVSNNTLLPFKKLGSRLDPGNTASVSRCYYKDSSYRRPLAVKVIDCCSHGPLSERMAEVKVMENLVHPHIARYIASYEITIEGQFEPDAQVLGIIMYPPGLYNLNEALNELFRSQTKERTQSELDDEEQRVLRLFGYFGCLSQAIAHIHDAKVRVKHKDVKPQNVIIDQYGQPFLIDFGESKQYAEKRKGYTTGGNKWTPEFAAPESYGPLDYGWPGDIFSLGCILLQLVTVLLGSSREALFAHLDTEKCYKVIPKIQTWLRDLPSLEPQSGTAVDRVLSRQQEPFKRKAREALIEALSTISRMLDSRAPRRPDAETLFTEFLSLYEFTPQRQVCQSCQLQHIVSQKGFRRRSTSVDEDVPVQPPTSVADSGQNLAREPEQIRQDPSKRDANPTEKVMDSLELAMDNLSNSRTTEQDYDTHTEHGPVTLIQPHQAQYKIFADEQGKPRRRRTTLSIAQQKNKEKSILVYDLANEEGVVVSKTSEIQRKFNRPHGLHVLIYI